MKIELYTLPSCGICHMVKTKLNQKEIPFKEKDFSEIAQVIDSDFAPALKLIDENGEETIYNNIGAIVNLINQWK